MTDPAIQNRAVAETIKHAIDGTLLLGARIETGDVSLTITNRDAGFDLDVVNTKNDERIGHYYVVIKRYDNGG